MLNRLLLLLVVCAPLSASAANLTVHAACTWTALTTGCTFDPGEVAAAATDNLTIDKTVLVTGNVTLTTGSITIVSGGTLSIGAGVVLTPGDGSVASGTPAGVGLQLDTGGILAQVGTRLMTCRLTSAVTWTAGVAATHKVTATTDCDLTGVSSATDYVFFGDEDPENLDAVLSGRCVHVGPGPAATGCYRPAFNKWASYKVHVDTETTPTDGILTWDLDPQAGNYVSAPYAGSRYMTAVPSIANSDLVYTARWLGRRTKVVAPVATWPDACIVIADRGSWYLSYDEIAGGAADTCSGLQAKVLNCVDGGAGDDTIEVEGDVSGCTSASGVARLTPGARRGDVVYIYRPATINGNTSGAATTVGEGSIINAGGFWYARWARMTNLWGSDLHNYSPQTARASNIGFLQGTSSSQPSADWDWVDIPYTAFTVGNDVGILHFVSATDTAGVVRYPDSGLVNMTGSKFRHMHIHDSLNNAVNGGGHGVYVDSGRGIDVAQTRIERINDDCIGAEFFRSNGAVIEDNGISLRHILNYECIASTANSQQGLEFLVEVTGDATHNPSLHTDVLLQDFLSIGHSTAPILMNLANVVLRGVTTGGQTNTAALSGGAAPGISPIRISIDGSGSQASFDDATLGFGMANAAHIYDSNLYNLGNPAGTASTPIIIGGVLHGTFVAGYDTITTGDASLGRVGGADGSVIDLGHASSTTGYVVVGGGSTPFYFRTSNFFNSVFRSTKNPLGANRFASGLVPTTSSGNSHRIERMALLIPTPDIAANGILGSYATSGSTITNSTTTINGLFVTANDATPVTYIAEAGSGNQVAVNNACMEASSCTLCFGGEGTSAHRIISNPLAPASGDTGIYLRDLVATTSDTACRGENLPVRLGYENFRIGHAQLGDFEIRDVARSSSSDLITFTPTPTGNGCTERWPCE